MALVTAAMMASPSVAAPSTWNIGDEAAWTGHTFSEEYWTADVKNQTADGANTTFSVSYVDAGAVEAFLVAFKYWEKGNATATLPYQLFGMHYVSPNGNDVFIGGVFAFLMAYNDTYPTGGNGLPNPGQEDVYYVLPFGVDNQYTNSSYPLTVSAIAATKVSDGHYRFGISYHNLLAKIIGANNPGQFWLSALLPIYIARFSELTVTYDITIDSTTHKASAETFYTIGEIQKLWLWGVEVDPHAINATWGLAAVHYGVIFTSAYTTQDGNGTTVGANYDGPVAGNSLSLKIGGQERFASIGFRGTYDLYDQPEPGNSSAETLISSDNQAVNAIVGVKPVDRLLVGWQFDFSADIFAVFAYGMSSSIRANFTSPQDLKTRARESFVGKDFWYAVSFPHFGGWKIVHDPTYEAYYQALPSSGRRAPGFDAPMAFVAAAVASAVAIVARRARRDA